MVLGMWTKWSHRRDRISAIVRPKTQFFDVQQMVEFDLHFGKCSGAAKMDGVVAANGFGCRIQPANRDRNTSHRKQLRSGVSAARIFTGKWLGKNGLGKTLRQIKSSSKQAGFRERFSCSGYFGFEILIRFSRINKITHRKFASPANYIPDTEKKKMALPELGDIHCRP